jgi:HK97 gp10 family phage protein
MMTVQITGLAELERKLIALGPKIATKAMRTALVSGAQVIKREAILRAPLPGIKRSIFLKSLKMTPFAMNLIIGVRKGIKLWKKDKETGQIDKSRDAFYWHWFEFGTKERYQKKGRNTGHIQKQAFIIPAFEAKKELASAKIVSVLKNKISQFTREPA